MIRNWSLGLVAAIVAAVPAAAGNEIYGTITTTGGRVLTGPIRWDNNENFWNDRLDTSKIEKVKNEDRGFRISLFGVTIGGADSHTENQLSIEFGHLRSIRRTQPPGKGAFLTLRTGEIIEVRTDHGDLGPRMRGIQIQDPAEGGVELDWRELKTVEFVKNPEAGGGRDGQRLYGSMFTKAGTFTGYINWDRDESMLDDVLDGYEDGEEREVAFRRIRAIEPGRNEATVTLTDDSKMVLDGTNDVNADNRGIVVNVGYAIVQARWRDVRKVEFRPAPNSPGFTAYDGGRRLRGTVILRTGSRITGEIIWDRDEKYTWEVLDGDADGLDYSVSFIEIRSIRRLSDSSEVKLRSGKTLVLSGSNDVDDDHRGLVVTGDDGAETDLDWVKIDVVEFEPGGP